MPREYGMQACSSSSILYSFSLIPSCMVIDCKLCFAVAQIAFMKELAAEGLENSTDVVFLDMDALFVDSIAEVSTYFYAVGLISMVIWAAHLLLQCMH